MMDKCWTEIRVESLVEWVAVYAGYNPQPCVLPVIKKLEYEIESMYSDFPITM
jgi:hypothetical protein